MKEKLQRISNEEDLQDEFFIQLHEQIASDDEVRLAYGDSG